MINFDLVKLNMHVTIFFLQHPLIIKVEYIKSRSVKETEMQLKNATRKQEGMKEMMVKYMSIYSIYIKIKRVKSSSQVEPRGLFFFHGDFSC